MRVYLAGQINGLTYDESTGWRNEAANRLAVFKIDALSPMRGKECCKDMPDLSVANYRDDIETSNKFVMRRDHMDVMMSDVILVNLANRKRELVGTLMELAWAYHFHKPVIAIANPDDAYVKHPFVAESLMCVVPTLDRAIDLIIKMAPC